MAADDFEAELKRLSELTGPERWPATQALVLATLRDPQTTEDDLVLAVFASGKPAVVNDDIVRELLALARSAARPLSARAEALDALVESVQEVTYDVPEIADEMPITKPVYDAILPLMRALHADVQVPAELRRAALEAWSQLVEGEGCKEAVTAAWFSGDEEWQLAAMYCMRHLFDMEPLIVEGLRSTDDRIRLAAIIAAGRRGVDAAWPFIEPLLVLPTPKPLLLAALDGAWNIRPRRSQGLLAPHVASEDPEIAACAAQALEMALSLCDTFEMARDELESTMGPMSAEGRIGADSVARHGSWPKPKPVN
jgi:hypothetical protein